MDSEVSKFLSDSPNDYHISDVLVKKVESDQSFLGIRHSELDRVKDNILKSLIDLRAEVYHDENERMERQDVIDRKVAAISILETKVYKLELERQRLNQESRLLAETVESERLNLRKEVDELLAYRRKIDDIRFMRELVYDGLSKEMDERDWLSDLVEELVLPNEMMNFQKIEDLANELNREIEKLERMKAGRSPSEINVINKQIMELQMKFNEDMLAKINFLTDENGRKWYYDQNGEKAYLNEFCTLMDELGDYVLDENGKKRYVREYANDENGRFYLDEDGNRIYKATPHAPEFRLLNGISIRIKDEPEEKTRPLSQEYRQGEEDHPIEVKSEHQNLTTHSAELLEDGKNTYVKEHAKESGRHHLEEDGNSIYKDTPRALEVRLLSGVKGISRISDEDRQDSEDQSIPFKSEHLNFLLKTYAEQLRKALVDVTWKQPIDPIDHLQRYLSNDVKKGEQRSIEEDFFATLEEKRRIAARQIFEAQIKEKRRLFAQDD